MSRPSQPRPASHLLLLIWEYVGELILAGLCCALLLSYFSVRDLHHTLCKLRPDLLAGVGVALGLSAVIWAGTLTMQASEFGAWLRKRGEASAYSRALATPVLIYVFVFLLLLVSACSDYSYVVAFIVFALIYGLINLVTMIRNVQGLVSLWQTWERTRK